MKRQNDFLRDYARRLDDDELRFIGMRLLQRLGGDVGEAVEKMQQHTDMDQWLKSAGAPGDFFEMVDQIDDAVQQEARKRFG